MLKTLENTKFANSPIIAVAANVGASDVEEIQRMGMDELITCLREQSYIPSRSPSGSFLFAVDHCFSIRYFICFDFKKRFIVLGFQCNKLSAKLYFNYNVDFLKRFLQLDKSKNTLFILVCQETKRLLT